MISKRYVTVSYKTDPGMVPPYKNGCAYLTAAVNARSRLYLLQSCEKLLSAGYFPLYTDTDSISCIRLSPEAPPIDTVLAINDKMGNWGLDVEDGTLMCVYQKKTYQIFQNREKWS